MSALPQLQPDPAITLCKALFRAADCLQLNLQELGAMLGLARSSLSRLKSGGRLDPDSKEGELALMILRIYRDLHALFGDDNHSRHWLRTHNLHLNGVPAELMQTAYGLASVVMYLDAFRGRY